MTAKYGTYFHFFTNQEGVSHFGTEWGGGGEAKTLLLIIFEIFWWNDISFRIKYDMKLNILTDKAGQKFHWLALHTE